MKQGIFSARTLFLCVAASVLARSFLGVGEEVSVRILLLRGTPAALALCLLSALFALEAQERGLFTGQNLLCRLGRVVFAVWFCWELAETVYAVQIICWEQFGSMAAFSLLPLLLWAGWKLRDGVFDRSAVVLLGLSAVGILLFCIGLSSQFAWQRLFEVEKDRLPQMPLYAEYFALPLLCPSHQQQKAVWLPLWAFLVQAADCLWAELIFGGAEIGRMELLRAAEWGAFSRFDAVFLLLWLGTACFRVCVLTRVLRLLWERQSIAWKGGETEP